MMPVGGQWSSFATTVCRRGEIIIDGSSGLVWLALRTPTNNLNYNRINYKLHCQGRNGWLRLTFVLSSSPPDWIALGRILVPGFIMDDSLSRWLYGLGQPTSLHCHSTMIRDNLLKVAGNVLMAEDTDFVKQDL